MSDINKKKLLFIISVMIGFTLVNIIKGNNWIGYLLSLIIFPLITWGFIEFYIWKLKNTQNDR